MADGGGDGHRWLEECPESTEISLDHFHKEEQAAYDDLSKTIDQSVKEYVKTKLRIMKYSEEDVINLAEEVMFDGLQIHENAEVDVSDLEDMNEAAEKFVSLLDRSLLLLVGPRGPSHNRKVELEEDMTAREMQYKAFCDIYPGIRDNPDKNKVLEPVNVFKYTQILQTAQEYLSKHASASRKGIIVFNGHGNAHGIILEKEEKAIPVDTLLQDLKNLVEQHCYFPGGIRLPQALDIILAECYSHCFSSPPREGVVQVIPLTSDEKPTTKFKIKYHRGPNGVKWVRSSEHEDLNELARRARDEQEGSFIGSKEGEGGDDNPSVYLDASGGMENITDRLNGVHFE